MATTAALDAIGNNISNVNNIVLKKQFMMQKYLTSFTTFDYNKFTNEIIGKNIKENEVVKKLIFVDS